MRKTFSAQSTEHTPASGAESQSPSERAEAAQLTQLASDGSARQVDLLLVEEMGVK